MEDALNEDERKEIRKDRASANQRETPFTRHLNEEMDNMLLSDLACKLCHDEEQEDKQEVEEADKPKPICKPLRPIIKEVEEHNLTHLPFRNWCIFCVRGKAKDDPHTRRRKQDEEQ